MNIYVGNLPRTVTEQTLRDLFEQFGAITSIKIIIDKFTGSPKGFAFVEMKADNDARQAIAAINGKEVDGQRLRVNEARPPEARPHSRPFQPRGGGNGGNGGGGYRSRN